MTSRFGSKRWIGTLSAMTAVTALSIDMSLPAQPTLSNVFDVPSATAQLTLSAFLAAFALAQLVTGSLSDLLGRRPVLLAGLALFTLSGIACTLSPSIEILIACRVMQGIGAAAAPVVARAMVRDTQPAAEAARLLSTMLAVLAIAPMVAPVIGSNVLALLGWRSIFATLAACGLALFALATIALEETLPAKRRTTNRVIDNYREFFRTPGTRLPTFVGCASFAGQFAYISDSPFVMIDGYGVSPAHFAYYFAATAFALMTGSLIGRALLRSGRRPQAMLRIGSSLLVTGGVGVFVCTHVGLGMVGFFVPMLIYFLGIGLTTPSATALALERVPRIAGTGSAAIGSLQMLSGAVAGYATTQLGGSSPEVFGIVVLAMGALASILAFAASRKPP